MSDWDPTKDVGTHRRKAYERMQQPRKLTPYDTGKRAEPKVWEERHRVDDDDYGKVDFNSDFEYTIATLYIEQEADGSYTLKGYANEALKIEIEVDE